MAHTHRPSRVGGTRVWILGLLAVALCACVPLLPALHAVSTGHHAGVASGDGHSGCRDAGGDGTSHDEPAPGHEHKDHDESKCAICIQLSLAARSGLLPASGGQPIAAASSRLAAPCGRELEPREHSPRDSRPRAPPARQLRA